jgi:paraquat-inducible protein B
MIEQGLRARLEIQSIVTGALSLSLNFYPGTEIKYGGEMPELSEIPSLPSALDILSDALGDVPLRDIVAEVRTMVSQATLLFKDEDLRRLPRELSMTMDEFRKTSVELTQLMHSANLQIGPVSQELRETLSATQAAMSRFDKVAERLDAVLSDDSPDRVQLSKLLEDIREASQQVKELAEYLQRNPDALVRGK